MEKIAQNSWTLRVHRVIASSGADCRVIKKNCERREHEKLRLHNSKGVKKIYISDETEKFISFYDLQ